MGDARRLPRTHSAENPLRRARRGKQTGSRTRLLRFAPGAFTTKHVVHEYWEEVYIVPGDFTIGGKLLPPNSYTCKPPGVYHGPFKSNGGCLLFEVHYFDPVWVRLSLCPLWVKSRHMQRTRACPIYPQERTCAVQQPMSALGQKRCLRS